MEELRNVFTKTGRVPLHYTIGEPRKTPPKGKDGVIRRDVNSIRNPGYAPNNVPVKPPAHNQ